jgi:glycosyltransferase involved in cell wall biosynthesis
MKILWICGAGVLGGAERATVEVASGLRARGHTVEVLCPHRSPVTSALARAGLPARPAPIGGSLNARSFFAITRAYRDSAPDVALVTTVDEWVWACFAKQRQPRPRLVLARHMTLPLNRRIAWLVNRRADAVVAVSDAVRRSLVRDAGIRPERVHVIHNPSRFPPRASLPTHDERHRARVALGLDPSGHWVGMFGGLDPAKGIDDVLGAVRRANDECGPTRLLVCGRANAKETARVSQRVDALGLHDRFRYLGEIERIAEAMGAVEVVVVATRSTLGEAFGLTAVEAMACGTPVLAYAVGGLPEVVGDDGECGRLARPDDAAELATVLGQLIADRSTAERLATNALSRVRTLFSPDRATDRYEQRFLSLVTT